MRKTEAFLTEDGQVFLSELEAMRHEFAAWATPLFGDAAVGMLLANTDELVRRLTRLAEPLFSPEAVKDLAGKLTDYVREGAAFPPAAPRPVNHGRFNVPRNIVESNPDLFAAITAGVEMVFPGVLNEHGTAFNFVGKSAHFWRDTHMLVPPALPPVYEWAVRRDERGAPIVSWAEARR